MSDSDLTANGLVKRVPITMLNPFKDHPFKVIDDAAMHFLTDSIRSQGVLTPLLVRPQEDNKYEIISGHRRFHAASLAGLTKIPVIIHDLDDDSAIIMMVDANLQRESILPSERAKAYKMKMAAMKRIAGRPLKNSPQVAANFRSDDTIALGTGMSGDNIRRYVRLTNLIPEFLDMVDNKKIAFNTAVELSYLSNEEQTEVLRATGSNQIQLAQAQQLKKLSKAGKFASDAVHDILFPTSPKIEQSTFSMPPHVISQPPVDQKASAASDSLPKPNPKTRHTVTDETPYLSDSEIESFLIVEDITSPTPQTPPMTPGEVFYELNDAMEDMLYRWRRSYNLYNEILIVPEHAQHVKDMLGVFYSEIDEIIKEKFTL